MRFGAIIFPLLIIDFVGLFGKITASGESIGNDIGSSGYFDLHFKRLLWYPIRSVSLSIRKRL